MMRRRLTTITPLLLVALLVALTFWLDELTRSSARGGTGSRNDPDYIVEKLSAVRLSEKGTASYTLAAARMVHYPDDDTTVLTAPTFVSHNSTEAPLTVTSSEAVVSANGRHVYFQDDVRITRAPYESASEIVVKTSFLHVMPDDKIAKTDRTVTVTDATGTITADGLELGSETRIIKLLSNVRGTYDPSKAPRR